MRRSRLIGTWLFMGFFLQGCKEASPTDVPLRPVTTVLVEDPVRTFERVFSGQLSATERTGIGFEVRGRIEHMNVKVGERKEKGALLARLDDVEYRNQFVDAESQLEQAKQEKLRTERLFVAENASQSQFDAANARAVSAQSAYNLAKKRLEDCELRMPYTGLIGRVLAEEQQLVNSGEDIVRIQGEVGLEFEIGVPAEVVGDLEVEMPCRLLIGGDSSLEYRGKIVEISPQVALNTTYPVVVSVEDPDGRIRAGMDGVATFELPSETPESITIPVECVVAKASAEPFVWIVKEAGAGEGILEKRSVSVAGIEQGGMLRVGNELKSGEVVLSRGVHRVEEGQRVQYERLVR